ncbi:hypothetical protein Tco_0486823 [Tanacetum coccineum]
MPCLRLLAWRIGRRTEGGVSGLARGPGIEGPGGMKPIDDVNDKKFESYFEEMHDTDEENDNIHDAKNIVTKKITKDDFFYMDDKKWEGMIKEAADNGYIKDTKECEQDEMFEIQKEMHKGLTI